MNHWAMIAFAYGLTFAALVVEVAFLFRRRRLAVRQAHAWLEAEEPPAEEPPAGEPQAGEPQAAARAAAGSTP